MQPSKPIVAHILVGARSEPYLPAVLASIAGVCTHAVVNDNSGCIPGTNDKILQQSRLAIGERLTLVHTTFSGFANARNACIDATPPEFQDGWVLFVDADEVHGPELLAMSWLLDTLPDDVDAVDGYSRHFVGSYNWWLSLERRLCFFRYRSDRRWHNQIHEQLTPIRQRAVLPAIWSHYGHVVTPRMEWEKSRLYSSLGQPGFSPTDDELLTVDARGAWGRMRGDAMDYHGTHPLSVRLIVRDLSQQWAETFGAVDALFQRPTPLEWLRRAPREANFSRIIAMRRLEARLWWNWSARHFSTINDFERRVTSQNGEDGIIAELFRRIGVSNRFFVEFGAADGAQCNTAQLARAGWSGLMLEVDEWKHSELAARYRGNSGIRTQQTFVTAENIASIFAGNEVPSEFDLLSIDIDGNDYWVWTALRDYRPRVVVIEYNPAFQPPRRWVMQYNPEHHWNFTTYYGASLSSLAALGREMHYSLVGTESMGVNAFFVRDDLVERAGLRPLDAWAAYHPPLHRGIHGELGHAPGHGPSLEI